MEKGRNCKLAHRRLSLWGKIMVFLIIPVLIIVLVTQFASIIISQRIAISSAISANQEVACTLAGNYEEMYSSLVSSINLITTDETIQGLMTRSKRNTEDWLNDNRELRTAISDKTILNSSIEAIYLYDSDGQMRTFWHRNYRLGSTVPIYPSFPAEWGLPSGKLQSFMNQDHLLLTRQINSRINLAPIGYCLVIYDRGSFDVSFNQVSSDHSNYVILVDRTGTVISHSSGSDEEAVSIASSCLQDRSSNRVSLPVIGDAIVSIVQNEKTGWNTISIRPVIDIYQTGTMLLRVQIAVSILSLILCGVLSAMMAHRWFVSPIRQIGSTLLNVESGDYTQRVQVNTGDELEELGSFINHMLTETDNLINQGLRNDLLQRESQLAALQAQINPHLLHNALECINWLAEFNRKDDIRKVTLALSHLMQSLTDAPRMVSIHEELEYTKSFLTIYDILLESRLAYTITINASDNTMIPRLMIQPLVENAVIHGIKPSMMPGHIDISVSETDRGLLISVYNDGIPIADDMVEIINRFAAGIGMGERLGVGLRNVIQRMRLLYENKASFTCSSSEIGGTVFDIILPYDNLEEGGADFV